jgi:hypothetical protein
MHFRHVTYNNCIQSDTRVYTCIQLGTVQKIEHGLIFWTVTSCIHVYTLAVRTPMALSIRSILV